MKDNLLVWCKICVVAPEHQMDAENGATGLCERVGALTPGPRINFRHTILDRMRLNIPEWVRCNTSENSDTTEKHACG